jgi:hypothetical protein
MVTREQLVTAEIIALEDARRMAAALHGQAQEEGEERIRAAVQRPPALSTKTSTHSDPADSPPTPS